MVGATRPLEVTTRETSVVWEVTVKWLNFHFKHILPRLGQLFARNDKAAYEYLPESVGQFPDGQALADRMAVAGMQEVEFTPLTFGVATIYVGRKPAATVGSPHS